VLNKNRHKELVGIGGWLPISTWITEQVQTRGVLQLISYFPRLVDDVDNRALYIEITKLELLVIISSFKRDKSLELDGWSAKFFEGFFDLNGMIFYVSWKRSEILATCWEISMLLLLFLFPKGISISPFMIFARFPFAIAFTRLQRRQLQLGSSLFLHVLFLLSSLGFQRGGWSMKP